MGLRKILTDKESAQHKVCKPVTSFDSKLEKLLEDMTDTLIDSGGVGLAAPQIGIIRRVVLVINEKNEIMELINPEILEAEGAVVGVEGCLSVPGKRGTVERPERLVVRAQDREGREFEFDADGLFAVCICHELDHLDGIVYVDKMIEDVTDLEDDEEYEEE